jgi:hypothetical protein
MGRCAVVKAAQRKRELLLDQKAKRAILLQGIARFGRVASIIETRA